MDEHIRSTMTRLIGALHRVLLESDAHEVAARLPWLRLLKAPEAPTTPWPDEIAGDCLRAHAVALQLLTQAEENAVAQARRRAESEGTLVSDPGSFDQHLARLQAQGLDAATIAEALVTTRVEPVLTAHPTEAKRQTILHHHRHLYRLIVELENSMWTASERAAIEDRLAAAVERLWRTGEVYLDKPTVASERRNVLHYLTRVFPAALPWVDARLIGAWRRRGLDPAIIDDPSTRPALVFGTWVGGDRDGHPFVTATTTAETLALFRAEALNLVRSQLVDLAARLSISTLRNPPPDTLMAWIRARAKALDDVGQAALDRNPNEPWRQAVNLMQAQLPLDTPRNPACYERASALTDDLQTLRQSLIDVGATRLARNDVDPVIRVVATFGFHLATLDVRQNSAFHDRALAQLLAAAGEDGAGAFPQWHEHQRAALLRRELSTQRPFTHQDATPTGEAQAVLGAYRVLAKHLRAHGPHGLESRLV